MARLPKGAEISISMAFVAMCAEKIRRLLRLFFVAIIVRLSTWKWLGCLWTEMRRVLSLETTNSVVVG